MIIRREKTSDAEAITEVTTLAFEDHPYSNQTEHFIIKALRKADALAVSLVAEIDGRIVGHIAFSPVSFSDGSEGWLGLGPISVLPQYQRQGIGTELIEEGVRLIKQSGAKGCVLVGDPGYYNQFGFKSPKSLSHEGVPQENFMVLAFCDSIPSGYVEFHPAFAAKE